MTTTLLYIDSGFYDLIAVIFLLIPFVLKIIFLTELNTFIKNTHFVESTKKPRFTWMIAIPIISFFYTFYIAKKIDSLIEQYKSCKYEKYNNILFINLIILIAYLMLFALIAIKNPYDYDSSGIESFLTSISGLSFVIGIISRFTWGYKLLKDIKEINTSFFTPNNVENIKNTPTIINPLNSNNQYYGGYNGGHNSSNTNSHEQINPPNNSKEGYHNGNLYN